MSIGEEPVGQVNGTLALRGNELSGEVDAASPRLALTGTGRIALTPKADAELTFRFHDTSLDPYVRLFVPKLSSYTTAVATGALRVVGELADIESPARRRDRRHARDAAARLPDPATRRRSSMALDHQQVRIDELQLVGEDTRLRVTGARRPRRRADRAEGDRATPGSGSCRDSSATSAASGARRSTAAIDGPLAQPQFSGSATIADGRIRHFSLPNSLDAINGTIHFDPGGIRLDDVTATMGGGRVQFGGRIGLDGYVPGDVDVTMRGEDMRLRVPEGMRSVVDADLSLRGNYQGADARRHRHVSNAIWNRRIDTPGSIFDLASRRSGGRAPRRSSEPATTFPLSSTCSCWCRRRCGSRTTWRGWSPAPI